MPAAATRSIQPVGAILLVIFAALPVYAFVSQPIVAAAVTAALALATLALNVKWRRRLAYLAAKRAHGSICDFARDCEYRRTDTWVIRAVYEEVQGHLRPLHAAFPVRASDRLTADLGLDPDDIDFDIATRVAQRCGRNLADTHSNPYYGHVNTTGDMVRFFCLQAREVQPNTSLERTRER